MANPVAERYARVMAKVEEHVSEAHGALRAAAFWFEREQWLEAHDPESERALATFRQALEGLVEAASGLQRKVRNECQRTDEKLWTEAEAEGESDEGDEPVAAP